MNARLPLEFALCLCVGVAILAGQHDAQVGRLAMSVGGATAASVCVLNLLFARWHWRTGSTFPRSTKLLWGVSLPAVASSAAIVSFTAAAAAQPGDAEGLRVAGWLCVAVAVWTITPWTPTPAGRALASLIARTSVAPGARGHVGAVRAGDRIRPVPVFPAGPRDPGPDIDTLSEFGEAVVVRAGRCRLLRLGDVHGYWLPRPAPEIVNEIGWWPIGRDVPAIDASYPLDDLGPTPAGAAAVTVGGLVVGLLDEAPRVDDPDLVTLDGQHGSTR